MHTKARLTKYMVNIFPKQKIIQLNKIPCSDVAEHNEPKMLNLL